MAFFQTRHLWIKQLADDVAVLVLDRDQSPENFLDPAMLEEVDRALDAVIQAGTFRLLVIRSAKPVNFCNGPAPALLKAWHKDDFLAWSKRGQDVCNKLANMDVPSVCVIAGSCCDAGLELALACDYRVVVNKASTMLGFPELEWGMVPCWGGTQRLPHLIGLDNSLHLLLTGQQLEAREAWTSSLADEFVEEAGDEPPAFLVDPVKRDWNAFPRRTWRERWLESNRPGRWFLFRGATRIVRTRVPDEMPAQTEMLQALRIAFEANLAAGLDFERQAMERIADHPALPNLIRLLAHREKMRGGESSGKRDFHHICILGTGTAGISLALHCVTRGYEVVLRAEDDVALGMALTQIIQVLQAEVQRGALTEAQFQKLLGAVRGTYTWTHFDKVDLVLDTGEQTLDEKRRFYQELEAEIPAGALVTPTSPVHRVEDLRAGWQHPQRVVGLHLIEPWSRIGLAEIVAQGPPPHPRPLSPEGERGELQRVREWAVGLGKSVVSVPDCAGGLVMRVWMPALNEAGILLKEGVAIERIDQAMRRFGMSFGPCEWMDRLGVDHVAGLASALQPQFAGRISLESGFSLMVEKGWLGNRCELGFYRAGLRTKKPNHEAVALWRTQSQGEPVRPVPALSEADALKWIQRRLVTLTLLEALRCLEEGIVRDADDLDCAMCLTGWATHRGGPIGHARHLGIAALTARCEELEREYGVRFALPNQATRFL